MTKTVETHARAIAPPINNAAWIRANTNYTSQLKDSTNE